MKRSESAKHAGSRSAFNRHGRSSSHVQHSGDADVAESESNQADTSGAGSAITQRQKQKNTPQRNMEELLSAMQEEQLFDTLRPFIKRENLFGNQEKWKQCTIRHETLKSLARKWRLHLSEQEFWKRHPTRADLARALHSHIVQWTQYFQRQNRQSSPDWNEGQVGAFGITEWGTDPQSLPPVGPYQKAQEKYTFQDTKSQTKEDMLEESRDDDHQATHRRSKATDGNQLPRVQSARPATTSISPYSGDLFHTRGDYSNSIWYLSRTGREEITPRNALSRKGSQQPSKREFDAEFNPHWDNEAEAERSKQPEKNVTEDANPNNNVSSPMDTSEKARRRASLQMVPEAFSRLSDSSSSDEEEDQNSFVKIRAEASPTLDIFADDSSDSAIDYEDYEPGQIVPLEQSRNDDVIEEGGDQSGAGSDEYFQRRKSTSKTYEEQLKDFKEKRHRLQKLKEYNRRRASLDRVEYQSDGALSDLYASEENHFSKGSSIEALQKNRSENLRQQCARALRELSQEPENRCKILKEGAFEALVKVLQDTEDSNTTFDCVASFFYLSSIQREVPTELNIDIQPLAAMEGNSLKSVRTPYVPRPLTGTMNSLEICNEILKWVLRNNTQEVVGHLDTLHGEKKDNEASSVDGNYITEEDVHSNVISVLCHETGSAKGFVRALLAACLFNLSTTSSLHGSISSKNVLQALFMLMHPATSEKPEETVNVSYDAFALTLTVRVLSNLCLSESGRKDFLENSGILKIARHWFWFSPRLQLTIAARILEPLARERDNLITVAEEGGVWMLRDAISGIYSRWKHRIQYNQNTGEPMKCPTEEDGICDEEWESAGLKDTHVMPVEFQLVMDSWCLRRCLRALARLCHVRKGMIKVLRGYGAAALTEGMHLLVGSPLGYGLEKFFLRKIKQIYGDLYSTHEYMSNADIPVDPSYSAQSQSLLQGFPMVADLLNNLRTPRILRKCLVSTNRILRHADFPLAALQGIGSGLAVSLDMLRRAASMQLDDEDEDEIPHLRIDWLDTRSVCLLLQAVCLLMSDKRSAIVAEKCGVISSLSRFAIMLQNTHLEYSSIPHEDPEKEATPIRDLNRSFSFCLMALYNASCHDVIARRMLLGIYEVDKPQGARNSFGGSEESSVWQVKSGNTIQDRPVTNSVLCLYHVIYTCMSMLQNEPPKNEEEGGTTSQQSLNSTAQRKRGIGTVLCQAIHSNYKEKFEQCQDIFLVNGYIAPLPCPTIYRCLAFGLASLRNLSNASLPASENQKATSRLLQSGIVGVLNPLFDSCKPWDTERESDPATQMVPLPLIVEGLKLIYSLSSDEEYGYLLVTSGALHYLVPSALDEENSPAVKAFSSYLQQLEEMRQQFPEYCDHTVISSKGDTSHAYQLRRVAQSFRLSQSTSADTSEQSLYNRMALFSRNALNNISPLLNKAVENCQRYCAFSLCNVSTDVARNQDHHCDGVMRGLVALANYNGTDTAARVKIAAAFRTLASSSPEICESMVSDAVAPVLVRLASSNEDAVRRHAAAALYYISRADKNFEEQLLKDDIIPALLTTAMIRSHDPMVQALCIEGVYNILANPAVRQEGLGASVIWVLQRLCTSPDTDVQRACAVTLLRLSNEPALREMLVRYGGIKSVVLVLLGRSEGEKEWESVSKNSWYEHADQPEGKSGLAINASMSEVFGEIPAEIKRALSHYASIGALSNRHSWENLKQQSKTRPETFSLSPHPRVEKSIGVRDPAVGTLFAGIIANVSKGTGNEIKLARAGAVEALSLLVEMGEQNTVEGRWQFSASDQISRLRPSCSLGLYSLTRCLDPEVHRRLIAEGGINILVRLGSSVDESANTRRLCCLGLSHLIWGAQSDEMLYDICCKGAPKVFISLIGTRPLDMTSDGEEQSFPLKDLYGAAAALHRLSCSWDTMGASRKGIWQQLNAHGTLSCAIRLLILHRNLMEEHGSLGQSESLYNIFLTTASACLGASIIANGTVSRKSFKILSGNHGVGYKDICKSVVAMHEMLNDEQFWSSMSESKQLLLELIQMALDDLLYVLALSSTHIGLIKTLFEAGSVQVCSCLLSCSVTELKTKVRAALTLRNLSRCEGAEKYFAEDSTLDSQLLLGKQSCSVLETIVTTCRKMTYWKRLEHDMKDTSLTDTRGDLSAGGFIGGVLEAHPPEELPHSQWDGNDESDFLSAPYTFSVVNRNERCNEKEGGHVMAPVVSLGQLKAAAFMHEEQSIEDTEHLDPQQSEQICKRVLLNKSFSLVYNCAGALVNLSAIVNLREKLVHYGAAAALISVSRHELTTKTLQRACLKALCEVAIDAEDTLSIGGTGASTSASNASQSNLPYSLKERVVNEGAVAALVAVMSERSKDFTTDLLHTASSKKDDDEESIMQSILDQKAAAGQSSDENEVFEEMNKHTREITSICSRSTVSSCGMLHEFLSWQWFSGEIGVDGLKGSVGALKEAAFLRGSGLHVKDCLKLLDLRRAHPPPCSVQASWGTTEAKIIMEYTDPTQGVYKSDTGAQDAVDKPWPKIQHKIDPSMLPEVPKQIFKMKEVGPKDNSDSAAADTSYFGVCGGDIADCLKPAPSRTSQHHSVYTDEGFEEDKEKLQGGLTDMDDGYESVETEEEQFVLAYEDYECDLVDSDSDDEEGQIETVKQVKSGVNHFRRSSMMRAFHYCQDSSSVAFPFVIDEPCVHTALVDSPSVYFALNTESLRKLLFVGSSISPGIDKNLVDFEAYDELLKQNGIEASAFSAFHCLRRFVDFCGTGGSRDRHEHSSQGQTSGSQVDFTSKDTNSILGILGMKNTSTNSIPKVVRQALSAFNNLAIPVKKTEYSEEIWETLQGIKLTSEAGIDGASIALARETILVTSQSHFLQRGLQLSLCELSQGVATDSLCYKVLQGTYEDPDAPAEGEDDQENTSQSAEMESENAGSAMGCESNIISVSYEPVAYSPHHAEEKEAGPTEKTNVFERLYNDFRQRLNKDTDTKQEHPDMTAEVKDEPTLETKGENTARELTLYDRWFQGKHSPRNAESTSFLRQDERTGKPGSSPNVRQRKIVDPYGSFSRHSVGRPRTTEKHRKRLFASDKRKQ